MGAENCCCRLQYKSSDEQLTLLIREKLTLFYLKQSCIKTGNSYTVYTALENKIM